MSVREGYKQTEIGVIPEDWEVKTFGNILTVKYGKNQKQVEDSNGLYPILGTGGLMGYANKFLYDKPSVLIGRKGTIDKPQYMDTPFWTVDTLFYTEINADIDPKWLFQKFKTIDWKKHNEASGVPSLSVSNIQRIVVSVPPLPEQQKIAEILSTIDQKINSIDSKIEETQTLKRGLMQRLLNEGIGHSEFKESEIGRIPMGWKVKTFGDILTVKYGKNQKQVEDPNGLYPILGTGGLMGYANKFLYNKPSVLIGRKGTIDKPQYMDTPFWTVDTLFYTEINADIDPKWLFQKFRTIDWKKHNEASGVPSLSVANIQRIIVSLPPLEEQKQIAEILSTTDEKLETLRAKKEAFETLKKGLMQKLLSGEVRVNG